MQFTKQDRQTLYDAWMSYKAKLRITQIEMARRMGVSQLSFSRVLHGEMPLEREFVLRFCNEIGFEANALPTFKDTASGTSPTMVTLKTTLTVDGDVTQVQYSGNQIIIEFQKVI